MRDGFVKVAVCSFELSLADVKSNVEKIKKMIDTGDNEKVNLVVFPELSLTGYTCGDLFNSEPLVSASQEGIVELANYSAGKYPLVVVGLPLKYGNRLFNCAAVLHDGKILGVVPKQYSLNHGQYSEKRYFANGKDLKGGNNKISIAGKVYPFGNNLIFGHKTLENFSFAVEIGSDAFAPNPPAANLTLSGAHIIANPAALSEAVAAAEQRRMVVGSASLRNACAYVHSNAGAGESTGDLVFGGHKLIVENSRTLAESNAFEYKNYLTAVIDTELLARERQVRGFGVYNNENIRKLVFTQKKNEVSLKGRCTKSPFVPNDLSELEKRADLIMNIQAHGFKRRIEHTNSQKVLIGISGGLDSTLALLAAVKTMDLMEWPRTDIMAVTMPCFGTTKRTKSNAEKLCRLLGVTFEEIDITPAVKQHFKDIDHDENDLDVTYENSQARERTQVLMDLANKHKGLVLGTGDLSELALGWATYNGDHMSMYAINAGVPKTLMRAIIGCVAKNSEAELAEVLQDVIATPVSPELLPTKEGELSQLTEDFVGPYELHDFFLYHLVRHGFGPQKIFRLAKAAFDGEYGDETIKQWLKVFIRRFFSQQYKRSCLPEGPKVGSVNLSPRSDWHMPSDATARLWLDQVDKLP
ncbi:MAG TPA: NAD(+) synthase [Clostridiales bacterium]|nr:NAD(+) synthase [Clostridiales bacterium]